MARLEYIHYQPKRVVVNAGTLEWLPEMTVREVGRLPQIFWADGQPWVEVNLFSLEMARNRDVSIKTVLRLMEHLHKYSNWLEQEKVDWRHFPKSKAERVLVRYRGDLIASRDHGLLSPSTTTARMRAVIRFYRYAAGRQFISREAPKWQDRTVVVRYFDSCGFERAMNRLTTDISISNRARPGLRLEDGLTPITRQHMTELLQFARENVSEELYLMLMVGFFTGARLGTITTLNLQALDNAQPDPEVAGMFSIPVGPGTGIATKFDVHGHLMVPAELIKTLRAYATSRRHLNRIIKSHNNNKSYLFLTRYFNPYTVAAVDREMVTLRRSGRATGLKFLRTFKFHQTRATFGTWLASICLEKASVKTTIEFVKRAMHHKNESTTFGYIRFIEHTEAKIEVANAFTEAFLGLQTRKTGVPHA